MGPSDSVLEAHLEKDDGEQEEEDCRAMGRSQEPIAHFNFSQRGVHYI